VKLARAIAAGLAAAVFLILADSVGVHQEPQPAPSAPTFDERMQDEGRVLWGEIDGHPDCWALIGDTSYVTCRDGYKTTS
jgi:hypothetical protein